MASNAMFAEVAALAGDPARAGMLHALMDGRALTASELAHVAGITPQTASGHLARMTAVGLLSVEKQGRHRYHRLATAAVAHMLESIMQVASELEPARKRLRGGAAGRGAAQSAHLLRPSGRPARRCPGRRPGGGGPRGAGPATAGIVTDAGVEFLDRIGIDMDGHALRDARGRVRPRAVPALPRLERAAAASGGERRRGDLHPQLRQGLDQAHAMEHAPC